METLLGSDAKSPLLPSVDMRVSKRDEEPHCLKQWHRHTDAELEVEVHRYRLMGQKAPNRAISQDRGLGL